MNANIRDIVDVALIEDKLRDNRLMQFGHICHRLVDAVVKRSDMFISGDNIREMDRPKLKLNAIVKKYIIGLNLSWFLIELNGVKRLM